MINFGAAAGVAAILGLAIYLAACLYHRVLPPVDKFVEALGFGAGIPAGIHMIFGAFHPQELCSIVDDAGRSIENPAYHLTFGYHTPEIVIGGAVLTLTALYSLGWLCRHPSHASHGSG